MQAIPRRAEVDSGGPYAEVWLLPDGVDLDTPGVVPLQTFVVRPQPGDYPEDQDGMTSEQLAGAVVQAMFARGLAQAQEIKDQLERQDALATAAQSYLGVPVQL